MEIEDEYSAVKKINSANAMILAMKEKSKAPAKPEKTEEETAIPDAIKLALADAMSEVERLRKNGASAKEMAESLRYVSVMTLAQQLAGEDRRLAVEAAKQLLDRSDGKAANIEDDKKHSSINIMNVTFDQSTKDEMARKITFMNELLKRRGVIDVSPKEENA